MFDSKMLDWVLTGLLGTFIPLFVATDVFVIFPIFASITHNFDKAKKQTIIRQSILTALITSVIFAALGEVIFRLLGITVNDFKIAGGMLLLVIAIRDILTTGRRGIISGDSTVGVVPLGVPLIVGPAVLTTTLVLIDHYGFALTVTSLVLNLFLVWICMREAHRLIKAIGKNGITALSKIMAILLAAIAVMMIRLGLEGIFKTQ